MLISRMGFSAVFAFDSSAWALVSIINGGRQR